MAKALLIVQGISSNPRYLKEEIDDIPRIHKAYDTIINAKVDRAWNKTLIAKIPFIGSKYGDIISFYNNKQARIAACKKVADAYYELKKDYQEIDILAHSLGTVIALCSGPEFYLDRQPIFVDKFICIESPLGLAIPFLGGRALAHAERYSSNFISKKIYNFYSSNDMVSKNAWKERPMNILSRHSIAPVHLEDVKAKHDHGDALETILPILYPHRN